MRRGFSVTRVWVAVSRQRHGCSARHVNASGCAKANFRGKPLRRCGSQRSFDFLHFSVLPMEDYNLGLRRYVVDRLGGHLLTWRGRLEVLSEIHTFYYRYIRTLMPDGEVIRTRTWEEPIPRDHQ